MYADLCLSQIFLKDLTSHLPVDVHLIFLSFRVIQWSLAINAWTLQLFPVFEQLTAANSMHHLWGSHTLLESCTIQRHVILISINSFKNFVHLCSWVPKFGTAFMHRAAVDELIELKQFLHYSTMIITWANWINCNWFMCKTRLVWYFSSGTLLFDYVGKRK